MITGISVKCEVVQGTFASEYFARIRAFDDSFWQGAVDKEMFIDIGADSGKGKYVNGRIYAYLISFDQSRALIELPTEDSSGRRIYVPISSVRKEKIPA